MGGKTGLSTNIFFAGKDPIVYGALHVNETWRISVELKALNYNNAQQNANGVDPIPGMYYKISTSTKYVGDFHASP